MEVIIRPDAAAATELTAQLIRAQITEKNDAVLGLATGRTMERLYERLSAMQQEGKVSFKDCSSFNLDEYVGLSPEDPNSYRYYMNHYLFERVDIDKSKTHLPNGMAADLKQEGLDYEKKITDLGGIDLQLLGIGNSGHIGFNEPLSAIMSRTREKALAPATMAQNAPLFDKPEDMPHRAMTMGVGTILDARCVIMLVTGEGKAEILAKAVEGPITSMISASALQLHPNCVVICDEAAATQLQGQEYYRWIFDNEPEWESYR
jgi:glucosamine-6-phosphate deaminase